MEANNKSCCSRIFFFMVMVGLTLVLGCEVAKGQGFSDNLRPSECQRERQLVTNACSQAVFGQPPSVACCVYIRLGHFECLCPMFTPKLISLINVNQTMKLLNSCGKMVPRHFKCGGLNFP
ncbi:hypothetical protein CsSME_00049974 [Camellia sinensis var. sinensis]